MAGGARCRLRTRRSPRPPTAPRATQPPSATLRASPIPILMRPSSPCRGQGRRQPAWSYARRVRQAAARRQPPPGPILARAPALAPPRLVRATRRRARRMARHASLHATRRRRRRPARHAPSRRCSRWCAAAPTAAWPVATRRRGVARAVEEHRRAEACPPSRGERRSVRRLQCMVRRCPPTIRSRARRRSSAPHRPTLPRIQCRCTRRSSSLPAPPRQRGKRPQSRHCVSRRRPRRRPRAMAVWVDGAPPLSLAVPAAATAVM